MRLITPCLELGAYLLLRGAQLEELCLQNGSPHRVTGFFVFTGSEVLTWEREYRAGDAVVNLSVYSAALNQLKDLLFARLRGDILNETPETPQTPETNETRRGESHVRVPQRRHRRRQALG